jgi:excisionase family DNA binding protein
MSKLSISEAAKLKGVSVSTLRRWEAEGKLVPERTESGQGFANYQGTPL